MSFEEIAALPVDKLAARDAVLFLWCTWPLVLHGGDPDRHYADAEDLAQRLNAQRASCANAEILIEGQVSATFVTNDDGTAEDYSAGHLCVGAIPSWA
jgi:hypothetical protein